MGLEVCHHTRLFAWVLETEFRDGAGLSSNTSPAELSPYVRETAFYLNNPEKLIIIFEVSFLMLGFESGVSCMQGEAFNKPSYIYLPPPCFLWYSALSLLAYQFLYLSMPGVVFLSGILHACN